MNSKHIANQIFKLTSDGMFEFFTGRFSKQTFSFYDNLISTKKEYLSLKKELFLFSWFINGEAIRLSKFGSTDAGFEANKLLKEWFIRESYAVFYSDITIGAYTEIYNFRIDEFLSIAKECEEDSCRFFLLMIRKINERLNVELPGKERLLFSMIAARIQTDILNKINSIKV